jgi:hypothetical protein
MNRPHREEQPNPEQTAKAELAALSECLQAVFDGLGYSVRAFARLTHRDPGSVSRYLSGRRLPPREFISELLDAEAERGGANAETEEHVRRLYHEALRATSGPATVRNAQEELEYLRGELESMRTQQVSAESRNSASHWLAFASRNRLNADRAEFTERLQRVSAGVVSSLPSALDSSYVRVTGIVQEATGGGRSRHCAAIIARALDAGYCTVIVFAGILNLLQEQTAEQLSKHLNPERRDGADERVVPQLVLNGRISDEATESAGCRGFDTGPGPLADSSKEPSSVKPRLLVLKQNLTTLRRLVELVTTNPSEWCNNPTLIVDMEPLERFTRLTRIESEGHALFSLRRDLLASLPCAQVVCFADPFQLWETDPFRGRMGGRVWQLWGAEPDFVISAVPHRGSDVGGRR